jgi:rare lipoprotein A
MTSFNTFQRLKVYSGVLLLKPFFFILCSLFYSPAGAQTQSGKASFYSKRATGSRTANGERLHHDSLTCAHRSYPFGTLLRVTNVLNNKQVVVRVNDRGPYRKGRIIDLSWGAAKEIGMIANGIVPVTVEKINEANVPFLPEDDLTLPQFEFELADIDPTGITPVWQQELNIDHRKVQRSMRNTATKSAQEVRQQTTASPATTQQNQQQQKPKDAFDEINEKPNTSKAYLKRAGK